MYIYPHNYYRKAVNIIFQQKTKSFPHPQSNSWPFRQHPNPKPQHYKYVGVILVSFRYCWKNYRYWPFCSNNYVNSLCNVGVNVDSLIHIIIPIIIRSISTIFSSILITHQDHSHIPNPTHDSSDVIPTQNPNITKTIHIIITTNRSISIIFWRYQKPTKITPTYQIRLLQTTSNPKLQHHKDYPHNYHHKTVNIDNFFNDTKNPPRSLTRTRSNSWPFRHHPNPKPRHFNDPTESSRADTTHSTNANHAR